VRSTPRAAPGLGSCLHLATKKGAAVVLDTTAITLFGNADHASYPCRA
jgi:hypothetical protein